MGARFRYPSPVNPRVVVIPVVILVGGLVMSLTAPVPTMLRILIFLSDCFAAVVVGLILWRREQR